MSLQQAFWHRRRAVLFSIGAVFPVGKVSPLAASSPERKPSQKKKKKKENWQQKRINCSRRMRKTSVCPRNLHNKDEEDPYEYKKPSYVSTVDITSMSPVCNRLESSSRPLDIIERRQHTNVT